MWIGDRVPIEYYYPLSRYSEPIGVDARIVVCVPYDGHADLVVGLESFLVRKNESSRSGAT